MGLRFVTRILAALALTLFALFDCATAWSGAVQFYDEIMWGGVQFPYNITMVNLCYNLSCFNKRAASIKWSGIEGRGKIDESERLYIAFYTQRNCTGEPHWWHAGADQPSNLEVDGISRSITSFMVWGTSKQATNGYFTPCPWVD